MAQGLSEEEAFQSTAPVWGPTDYYASEPTISEISIHGPRVGADCLYWFCRCETVDISIHGPRVGADLFVYDAETDGTISIHGPRVGADIHDDVGDKGCGISIHGPRVGADCQPCGTRTI